MSEEATMFTTAWTHTALFLIPIYGIGEGELAMNGYQNAYLVDVNRSYEETHIIFVLFRPQNDYTFGKFTEKLEEKDLILDEYDYEDGYVVLVLHIPEKFKRDFDKILLGKYSKCSEGYKKIFPKRVNYVDGVIPRTKESFHYRVLHKSPQLKEQIEDTIGELLDDNAEYWSKPDMSKETMNIDQIKGNG